MDSEEINSLQARQLLTNIAKITQKEKESFSKEEIAKRVNEIKYLTEQKKVPRLTLRKELIHLENQLQGIFTLESQLRRHRNKENVQIEALKKQIKMLKNKLRTAGDKDLDKKVEKITHLLGDHLAKINAQEAIELSMKVLEETSRPSREALDAATVQRVKILQERLSVLKHELEIHKELQTKQPREISLIESKISLIEDKLKSYYEKYPELRTQEVSMAEKPEMAAILAEMPQNFEVKHEMMFPKAPELSPPSEVKPEEFSADKPLPLPPPPRLKK